MKKEVAQLLEESRSFQNQFAIAKRRKAMEQKETNESAEVKSLSQYRREVRRSIVRTGTLDHVKGELASLLRESVGDVEVPEGERQAHLDTIEALKYEYGRVHDRMEMDSYKVHFVESIEEIYVDEETLVEIAIVKWRGGEVTHEPWENLKNNIHMAEYWRRAKEDPEHPLHAMVKPRGN